MTKIGVLGAGHLGRIHLRLLAELGETYTVAGFYDPDPQAVALAQQETSAPALASEEAVLEASDAVIVVSYTQEHFRQAEMAIKRGKHVFIEKPMTATAEEARKLVAYQQEAGVVGQVGMVERFNPAYLAVSDRALQPMFIEAHRLAQWNPRGADVSVVLDLMIHDLDIVLHLVDSGIKRISASGVPVIAESPDIANARIEFHNGCVANLTASRISLKNMRKMRLFQKNTYLTIDFLEKQTELYNIAEAEPAEGTPSYAFTMGDRTKWLIPEQPEVKENNAIRLELVAFAQAIEARTEPPVSFYQAHQALQTAHQILEKITPLAV